MIFLVMIIMNILGKRNENQKIYVDNYLDKNIEPFISQIALDLSVSLALIPNKNLNIFILLKRKKSTLNQKFNYGRFLEHRNPLRDRFKIQILQNRKYFFLFYQLYNTK